MAEQSSAQIVSGLAFARIVILVYHLPFPLRQAVDRPEMPGLDKYNFFPTEIRLHRKSRCLEISFSDGKTFLYPCEFLRVHSPSAEVRGHSPGQEVLQTGKRNVNIIHIEPVGNYAIQLNFSDGHNTGLYSWDLLYDYGVHQDEMWQRYLRRLEETGGSREQISPQKSVPRSEGR